MYEIFEKMCEMEGITPYKFAKENDVSPSTLSTWKAKNSIARPELANKVCDYFHISTEFLEKKSKYAHCSICHNYYDALDKKQFASHKRIHEKYVSAKEFYGLDEIPLEVDSDDIINSAIADVNKYSSSHDERLVAFEKYLRGMLIKELNKQQYDYSSIGPYDEFCAKIVGSEVDKDKMDEVDKKLYTAIVDKYGIIKPERTELSNRDERDISKRLSETLNLLESEQDALMFDGQALDDTTRELLKASLENSLKIGKINAKEKYTPKKYKKD